MQSFYHGIINIQIQRRAFVISKYQVIKLLFIYIEKFRDARSLFRLLKFTFEVKRIQIISSTMSQDAFSLVTNISSRAFYFFYWLFDNIYILLKYADIHSERFPLERFKSLSRTFWLLGISMFLIYCIKTLRKTYTDESDLKVAALNKMTVK